MSINIVVLTQHFLKEEQLKKLETYGEELRNTDFELAPHQMFVRNFYHYSHHLTVSYYFMI